MRIGFPHIDQLPRRNATQAKNKWSDLVREAHRAGGVAVTHHERVEIVVMDAERYREMVALVDGAQERRRASLAELTADFDRHLADLQAPDARKRVDAAMASRGRNTPRPKAGRSF